MLEIHFGSRLPGFSPSTGCPAPGRLLKYLEETFTVGTLRMLVPYSYQGYVDGPPSGLYLRLGPSMNATSYHAAYAESRYSVTACFHAHQTVYSAAACIHYAGGYVVAVEDGVLRTLTDTEEVEFQTAMRGRTLPSVAHDYDFLFRANRGLVKPS